VTDWKTDPYLGVNGDSRFFILVFIQMRDEDGDGLFPYCWFGFRVVRVEIMEWSENEKKMDYGGVVGRMWEKMKVGIITVNIFFMVFYVGAR